MALTALGLVGALTSVVDTSSSLSQVGASPALQSVVEALPVLPTVRGGPRLQGPPPVAVVVTTVATRRVSALSALDRPSPPALQRALLLRVGYLALAPPPSSTR